MKDRSKQLLRLSLADQSFREADAIAEHLLSTNIEPGSHLYHAGITGLVTSYCRPFMSASGLGRLAPDFEVFSNTEDAAFFTQVHIDISTARDKLAAHFDLEYGVEEYQKKRYTLHPGEVELELGPKGFAARTNHTTLPPERIRHIRMLISLQLQRVQKGLSDFAISILKETNGKLGSYVFVPQKKGA